MSDWGWGGGRERKEQLTEVYELLHGQGRWRELWKPLHLLQYSDDGSIFQQHLSELHFFPLFCGPRLSVKRGQSALSFFAKLQFAVCRLLTLQGYGLVLHKTTIVTITYSGVFKECFGRAIPPISGKLLNALQMQLPRRASCVVVGRRGGGTNGKSTNRRREFPCPIRGGTCRNTSPK